MNGTASRSLEGIELVQEEKGKQRWYQQNMEHERPGDTEGAVKEPILLCYCSLLLTGRWRRIMRVQEARSNQIKSDETCRSTRYLACGAQRGQRARRRERPPCWRGGSGRRARTRPSVPWCVGREFIAAAGRIEAPVLIRRRGSSVMEADIRLYLQASVPSSSGGWWE